MQPTGQSRFLDHPPRREIASYTSYAEAQRAVDYLSDQRFAVERVAIVADGIKFVERVTGRLDSGRAALNGALSWGLLGAMLGLILGLFSAEPAFAGLARGFLFGLVAGAISGLLSYSLTGGRRDFTSVSGMQAERYLVMVDEEVSAEAARVLEGMPAG
ncbi:MAG TPA: general stress protein [Deinococcales bacterium]|nr:general stress protein [Deinococcales bacterium]